MSLGRSFETDCHVGNGGGSGASMSMSSCPAATPDRRGGLLRLLMGADAGVGVGRQSFPGGEPTTSSRLDKGEAFLGGGETHLNGGEVLLDGGEILLGGGDILLVGGEVLLGGGEILLGGGEILAGEFLLGEGETPLWESETPLYESLLCEKPSEDSLLGEKRQGEPPLG